MTRRVGHGPPLGRRFPESPCGGRRRREFDHEISNNHSEKRPILEAAESSLTAPGLATRRQPSRGLQLQLHTLTGVRPKGGQSAHGGRDSNELETLGCCRSTAGPCRETMPTRSCRPVSTNSRAFADFGEQTALWCRWGRRHCRANPPRVGDPSRIPPGVAVGRRFRRGPFRAPAAGDAERPLRLIAAARCSFSAAAVTLARRPRRPGAARRRARRSRLGEIRRSRRPSRAQPASTGRDRESIASLELSRLRCCGTRAPRDG